ncbi:hypothetical protein [Methanococcoides sp. FTZ1]|uniref:hypothetical protein n=1 Tax=Methanococcoides sp. FTZ1 TaxID=3439061 RepID=UPI003F8410F2
MLTQYRLIVQKSDGNKYYPGISGGQILKQFPFACSTANIDIPINSNVAIEHLSPIRCDDVVRLQVCQRMGPDEQIVWIDLFEGRIMSIGHSDSPVNAVELICRGHEEEAVYRAVTVDYSASSATTGTILSALQGSYMSRITDAATSLIDSSNSTTLTSFNVDQDTKYMIDVIKELERLEGYTYRFSVLPSYDSSGNLSAVYGSWQLVPTTPTSKYQLVAGTLRYIQAHFDTSISSLVNDITIYGASGSPQKVGTATDATSQSAYNTRHHIDSDLGLSTDALCNSLASAVKDKFKDPLISGWGVMQLTPEATPGDLVYCKNPDIYVNGEEVDGNYTVKRVVHDLGAATTRIEVGELVDNVIDMISEFYAKDRLNNANFIG